MKKIMLIFCLLTCLFACKSNVVDANLKEVLEIKDVNAISDATETVNLSVSNDDYTLNILDVVAYHNYFMLFGKTVDSKGNNVCIEDYTFTINDLDTYDLNAFAYGFRYYDDGYFMIASEFDGIDLMKGDKIKLVINSFGDTADYQIVTTDGINDVKEYDNPLLELEIAINKIGKTNKYGDNDEIEITPFYLSVFADNELNIDSVKLLDSSNNQIAIQGKSACLYNEWLAYFDKYMDISNIAKIQINDDYIEIILPD